MSLQEFPRTDLHVLFKNFPKPVASIDRAAFAIAKGYRGRSDYRGSIKGCEEIFSKASFLLKEEINIIQYSHK